MVSVIMLSVIMLSVIMLSVIMLSVVMLSVTMLSAVMLNVLVPFNGSQTHIHRLSIYCKIVNRQYNRHVTIIYDDSSVVSK